MKYTLEEEIIHFVFIAFNDLKRKKENIGLAFHSITVGNMLKNIGCGEDTIYIGYLHDIIEDTNYTYNTLLEKYGKKIADSVEMLSENKSIKDYKNRKENFIEKIRFADSEILIVELADKLHNLVSDYDNYKIKGKDFLITEASNYETQKWFYLELKKIFNEKLNNNELLDRYNDIVSEYFEWE